MALQNNPGRITCAVCNPLKWEGGLYGLLNPAS